MGYMLASREVADGTGSMPIDGWFGAYQYRMSDRVLRQRVQQGLAPTIARIQRSTSSINQYESQFTSLHDRTGQ